MMSRGSSSLFMKERRRSLVRLMTTLHTDSYIRADFINESVLS